ncbi:SusD/RagB family nutrient-binding outer membrane lipoprotein [Aureibaculum sp. A20]|uniref:SusD/RagB family nutrient-binding outer membrane lipoprotein n=1 Tax=Aureibaculum flavum TaxID=2795986 RepID=A0ABS0WT65_9FLAO|nr:SusD/RagB family nutrient-binding outer membrane lipoprotein [Aureibaculum flavum]MBJ2175038.1 SusD/RagB family nutrient-binding outer membrane lipoprotein [Aureibaculum flavum]
MKKFKYIILTTLLVALGACENVDFGDTNVNPNGAGEANTSSLMAGAMSRYSTLTGRNDLLKPTLYVQYQTQVTYVDEMLYNEAAVSWYNYYVQTLSNLQLVIDINSDEANHNTILLSQGAPVNQIAVAEIFKIIIFKRITDTWGDIPYAQALQDKDNLSPVYDSQSSIYESMLAQLKTSRDNLDDTKLGPTGDILFGGDVAKWKKMVNSLILQFSLQLSNKYPSASGIAATAFNEALSDPSGVIEDLADEAWFLYNEDFQNPFAANRKPDYFLSQEFTDALKGLGTTSNTLLDGRINVYSNDPTKDGVPYGFANGSGAGKAGMSDLIWTELAPLQLLTSSYTYLNRADAANLGWTSENASAMLKLGIERSFQTLDAHYGTTIGGSASTYATARVADMVAAGATKVIAEEKWVSLFPNGFDAWSEWRRTDFPTLIPATDFFNDGQIPRRYNYPTEESSLNETNYNAGVGTLSPSTDKNTSRFWWDQ